MTVDHLAELLRDLASALPVWLLLTAASVGHGFLWIISLNVLYAWPLPHALLKVTRKIDLLAIMAGPAIFWYALDIGGAGQLAWDDGKLRYYLAPYTIACAFVGLVLAPLAELLYLTRRTAPQLTATRSATIDIAKALGYAPEGKGKKASLCRLPGNQVFQV